MVTPRVTELSCMQPWVLSDGTEIRLGGEVTGESSSAKKLRQDIFLVRHGEIVLVHVGVPPSGSGRLDLSVDYHVDAWVRDRARFDHLKVVRAPAVSYPRSGAESDPDAIY